MVILIILIVVISALFMHQIMKLNHQISIHDEEIEGLNETIVKMVKAKTVKKAFPKKTKTKKVKK